MFRPVLTFLAVLLIWSLCAAQTPGPCQPPALHSGTPGQNIFSEEQESDLGDAIAEHLQRNFRVIDDDEVTAYLDHVGRRLIKHLPPSNLRFQFFLVDIPDANAFTLPGGRIYVSRKLVASALSEDEVAGVIAHELGHLLAHQGAIQATRWFKEVLGVTSVGDRRDIFDKYNQLVDNAARKRDAFSRGGDKEEGEQLVADQIGLYAAASAGYDPHASASFFDRVTENKGKKGSFFSDLFGATKPESKRYREMIKSLASMPSECVDARGADSADQFKKWQAAVVNYTGLGRRESLHAVLRRTALNPPLRGEVTHFRFSPDGTLVLAQDDTGINVLSVEPFTALFRIDAPEAKPAQFTPDSQNVAFSTAGLRVEVWSIAEQKMKEAHELVVRKGCLQTRLSPDAKTMACLDPDLSLDLIDVATGAQFFQKKEFYVPSLFELIFVRLANILDPQERDVEEVDWINMSFSPDGRYFAAGARSTSLGVAFDTVRVVREDNALAVDLNTKQTVSLHGPLKKLMAGAFAFIGPDRIVGLDRSDPKKSGIVAFPSGQMIDQVPLGGRTLTPAAHGNFVVIRPIQNFPVGIMDLGTKKIFLASKIRAIDIHDHYFVSERSNGEIALYEADTQKNRAVLTLPQNPLGRLRASALSPDLKWIAVSERTRGAVWNVSKGERAYMVRGFRGGYFSDDNAFYADFPAFEQADRAIGRLDLAKRDVTAGPPLNQPRAEQFGRYLLVTKPAKEGDYEKNVTLEVHDVRDNSLIWSKAFPKEAPRVWVSPRSHTIVLSWAVSDSAAQSEIKSDAVLAQQLATMKEKEGDYFLQVFDLRTGKATGRLLVETGKGSFRITRTVAAGEWLAISDTQNRTLVYSLSSGEQKGKVFGSNSTISAVSGLLAVENEPGRLAIYNMNSMEKRDQLTFSSPLSLAAFSDDGSVLFVLTANQTIYQLDVAKLKGQ